MMLNKIVTNATAIGLMEITFSACPLLIRTLLLLWCTMQETSVSSLLFLINRTDMMLQNFS